MKKDRTGLAAGMDKLVELMARLRAPDGCPWDRDQTPESLTPYIIEEAYELVEAIREDDPGHVCEELGDLLFQIVFQAHLAGEAGKFNLSDVIRGIHEKMTRRHPHVFGTVAVENSAEVRRNWVRLKEEEGKRETRSALGKVPRSLPALLRARRLTENAAEVGFDWESSAEVLKKLQEELEELNRCLPARVLGADGEAAPGACPSSEAGVKSGPADGRGADEPGPAKSELEDEFGDVLFVLVNLSRFLSLDPEQALSRAIAKFERRFHYLEQKAAEAGRPLEAHTLQEMDKYWDEAKKKGL